MNTGLTTTQSKLYKFIKGFIAFNGEAPSYPAMGDYMGVTQSAAYQCVTLIVKKGYLERVERRREVKVMVTRNEILLTEKVAL